MNEPSTASSERTPSVVPPDARAWLRHPLEKRVAAVVAVLDAILVAFIVGFLLWGTEWLEARPTLGKYKSQLRILLIVLAGAPIVASYARQARRILAQEESIRVSAAQLPEIHRVLVRHCARIRLPLPDLYLSDAVDYTTSFASRGRQCIVLSTRDFELCPDSSEDVIDFALARQVGAICLGHTSFRNEVLRSFVSPIPFLRGPLNRFQTYSCDRYGAFLAPRAIRAVIVAASGDRFRNLVNLDAYFAQLDEGATKGFWMSLVGLAKKRVPLARRILELRRAGLLTKV